VLKEKKLKFRKKEKKIIKDDISNKIIETAAIIIQTEGITAINVSKNAYIICSIYVNLFLI